MDKPFGVDADDHPLFLHCSTNDTLLTFDAPFELLMGPPPNWIVDGEKGGMWAVYCMLVKIMGDEMKFQASGLAFLQRLSMTWHFTNLDSAAEVCKKMLCRMPPPPASSASSSAVPAQQAYMPAVPILGPDIAEVSPLSSMD